MGLDVVRRAREARVHRVVSVADRGDPHPSAAAALRAVSGLEGPRLVGHHPPARGGDPVGLGRAPEPAELVGPGAGGASAGGVAGPFRAVAGGAGGLGGLPAPDRGPRPRDPQARWSHAAVAVRPDGHGLLPDDRDGLGGVRPGREALRGRGRSLPTAPRQPQGRGREGQPLRRATLVAHGRRRRHRHRRRAGPR